MMAKKVYTFLILSTILFLVSSFNTYGQFRKKKSRIKSILEVKETSVSGDKEKEDVRSIASLTRKCKKYEGLFNIYQDTISGNLYMVIKKEQLDQEFIYFSQTVDGITSAGHHRGSYKDNKVFSIKKYYDRIEFVAENTNYYFDEKNPLSRASDANISNSILLSLPVLSQNRDQTEFLIRADDIFLSENLQQVKSAAKLFPRPGEMNLGGQNKDKSKILNIKSYPKNTNVVVEYVYDSPSSPPNKTQEVADARSVGIKIQHSIIEMPENNFKPRFDDPRIGYFTRQVNDMTSNSATPYRDIIHRWYLEKKEPGFPLSEPVEPIVWWLENTTPLEYREIIKSAVLTWNEAFEEAGFKNAIEVKIQPDDAEWDAGDLRYNVIRWTSSPNPPYGGYGPSFVNPRTGQILGADIMIEYSYLTNRLNQERLFKTAGLSFETDTASEDANYCSLGNHLQMSNLFGQFALSVNKVAEIERHEYIKQSLYYLILHELGHTFGLNHNMKASNLYSPTEIHNKELSGKTGLTSSVMDYPAVNLSSDKEKQGHYFTMKPGPYDKWAIEYGYSESLNNQIEEKQRLGAILERSSNPQLMFGNDADDMRAPGKGIDPRVMVGDMSNDAISYSIERIQLSHKVASNLIDNYSIQNESYHQLRNAYLVITTEINKAASVVSRYIGGIYVDRSFSGQSGAQKPFTPVPVKDQKRAMEALSAYVFAPDAFSSPENIYNYLQMQRRGFGFMKGTEDPKVHDRILTIQSNVLAHLLHPVVLQRISDSELYGNGYKLPEVMNDLTIAIFKSDLAGQVNTFRQNLQFEYTGRLIEILNNKHNRYDSRSLSNALYQLKSIEKMLKENSGNSIETKAHREHILFQIKKALENS